jgi:hypothetical protein
MKQKLSATALALLAAAGLTMPDPAMARRHHYVHTGYSHRCSGGDGVVGTVVGGTSGAVLGSALIGGPVAIIAGGVGGALLGRHIDKQNVRYRHGC